MIVSNFDKAIEKQYDLVHKNENEIKLLENKLKNLEEEPTERDYD